MKIKIFYLIEDIKGYENEINEFIKNKKVIDIKHSISSYGMANDYTSTQDMDMSTLIMYEEMEGDNADSEKSDENNISDSNDSYDTAGSD